MSGTHIVLMGDSIFDNRPYTGGGPAVVDQVGQLLGSEGRATLVARDGDRVRDLTSQTTKLPSDVTHIVVSVGGNDALDNYTVLMEPTDNVADTMLRLGEIVDRFEEEYRRGIQSVVGRGVPVTVCTIYNGNFDDEVERQVVSATVRLFNDAIYRVANDVGIPVIDLRSVCRGPEDYANPIEPSSIGGEKIARAILATVT